MNEILLIFESLAILMISLIFLIFRLPKDVR